MIIALYILGALIAWPFCARFLIHDVCGEAGVADSHDLGMGILLGWCIAIGWPIVLLVALGIKIFELSKFFLAYIFVPKSVEYKP